MRHFPLDGSPFAMTLGVRPLLDEPLLEPDDEQVAIKRQLLDVDHGFHFAALPGTEQLQAGAAAEIGFSQSSFDQAGRNVAEDLLLLSEEPGWPLVAGQLCFPNDWCLADKLGRSLLGVHEPVPQFVSSIGDSTLKLLDKLKPGRPVWRLNWALKVTDRLDLPPHVNATFEPVKNGITSANAGERCYFRIERQTLSRLPHGILFTVKTSVAPLNSLAAGERKALDTTLRTAPPEMLAYKGITPFAHPVLAYLSAPH
jgi:hypothetical protein